MSKDSIPSNWIPPKKRGVSWQLIDQHELPHRYLVHEKPIDFFKSLAGKLGNKEKDKDGCANRKTSPCKVMSDDVREVNTCRHSQINVILPPRLP
jgi:hypothetical protein